MTDRIDFHSHVLPGVDDGSRSVEESVALLRMLSQQGIAHVVATPHYLAHCEHPEAFLERREKAEILLREKMKGISGLPALHVGAEVSFYRGISDSSCLPLLTIDGKNCILIEMMPPPWPEDAYRELEAIWKNRGILPVIAHIDRYIRPFRTYGIPDRLRSLPVAVQANASFFLRRSTAPLAYRLLRSDGIQLLGSDCHNTTTRKPEIGPALACIEKRLGEETVRRLTQNGEALLELA